MQTLTRPQTPGEPYKAPKRPGRRFSPLMLITVIVTVVIALGAGVFFVVRPIFGSHAAANPNPNCSLRVPANPLSAQGLATPYKLSATDPAQGPCNEANAGQSAFVQAVIFDPATNTLSAYEPLVIDRGTQPAVAPVAPQIPQGSVVGLWFGFNGTFLHLTGGTFAGRCVNGTGGSDFGQFARSISSTPRARRRRSPMLTRPSCRTQRPSATRAITPCSHASSIRRLDASPGRSPIWRTMAR